MTGSLSLSPALTAPPSVLVPASLFIALSSGGIPSQPRVR